MTESRGTGESEASAGQTVNAFSVDAAFDVVPDWIALIDTDCVVRRANAAMASAFGLEPADLVGKRCYELVHGLDHPLERCPHLRLLRDSGRPTNERVAIEERGLFDVSCSPLHDASGAIVGTVHLAHDVTSRVLAEQERRERDESLQHVIDAIPAPVFQKGADGVYRLVNQAFALAVGRDPDAILGTTALDLYPRELADELHAHDEALARSGGQDIRLVDKTGRDGETRRMELHRSAYADAEGRPAGVIGVEFDVTDRERTEAALRRTEAELRRAQQVGHMGSWEWDLVAEELHWSDELYRIWGVDRDFPLTPESIVATVHPDDRGIIAPSRADLLAGLGNAEVDLRIIRSDGQTRSIHMLSETEFDDAGDPIRVFGIMQDVTDLLRTRKSLEQREALVRGLFDTMPSGCSVYEVRGDGRSGADYVVKDMNRSSLAMEGRRRKDVIGKSLKDLRPEIDDYGLIDVFWRVSRTGDPEHFPAKLYTDERYANWYDNYVFTLPTGEIVAICNDVTAEKRAEDALRASEAEMHAVFDLVGIPMFVMDTSFRFTRWNRAFRKALGYPTQEMRNRTIYDVTLDEDRADMLRRLSLALTGEHHHFRLQRQLVTEDGSRPWFDLSVTPVIDRDGDVAALIGAGTDVTESRHAQEAVMRNEERLRVALGETVAAMGAIVALRDPYTAGHERRVTRLAEAIAHDLGLEEDVVDGLRHATSVHDVGKVAVPAEILTMPRRLTEWEFSLVQTHAAVGHEILAGIAFEQPVAEIVLQHHERLDGSGYPHGLKGDEILLQARILAVADVVEAMASHRPYRPAVGVGAALDEIQWGAGRRYDEKVVASCLRVVRRGVVDLSEPAT